MKIFTSEEINSNLNSEIEDLKKKLEEANARIDNLEKELKNKEGELSDISKFTNEKITSLSTELEQGKRKISELEKSLTEANSTISTKDDEINKLRADQERFATSVEESNRLKAEFDDLKNKTSVVEEDNANLSSQLAELNNLLSQKDTELQELNNTISEKDKLIEEQAGQLEELKAKLFELQPPEILTGEVTTEARVKCINCGAVGKDIKVVEDKSKVLSYIGGAPMYAKKHVCKKCGYEF